MERSTSTQMFRASPTTAWILQNACSTRQALPQRQASTSIRRTEGTFYVSVTQGPPPRCMKPSSVSATGYDVRCEPPTLGPRLSLECAEDRADPLAVDIFRRCGVTLRLKPCIAIDVICRNHFSGAVVESAFLATAFFVCLQDDRGDTACRFSPFRPGQGGHL